MRRIAAIVAVVTAIGYGCDDAPSVPGASTNTSDTSPDTSADTSDTSTSTSTSTSDTSTSDTSTSDTSTSDTSTSTDAADTVDVVAPACDPPLTITPAESWTPARRLVTFVASGGTGQRRFELTASPSGATINTTSGAYLSGAVSAVTDVIRVTDLACTGEATAAVHVTDALAIVPALVQVAPSGTVAFTSRGGSGDVHFELVGDQTGASLTAEGAYVAGPTTGIDQVRIVDHVTGEETDAFVTVTVDARLRMDPEHLFMPLGERHRLVVAGGSGEVDALIAGTAVTLSDGWFESEHAGTVSVTLTDRRTTQTATARVTIVGASPFPSVPAGDSSSFAIIKNIDDVDGDGFDDVIVGMTEADVGAWDTGGLFVYAGTAQGLAPTPAQVISGPSRQDHLGRGFAVGDLDGDGLPDLVVGASDNDLGGSNAGAVFVYPGVASGFFAPSPSRVLIGRFGGDGHGFSVAIGDFNGDGHADLAVGARTAEDRTQNPQAASSGGVHLYLGTADGTLPNVPDAAVWGRLPVGGTGGTFEHIADMQLGWDLAAGDIDGDGKDDLVAVGIQYASAPGRAADGAVLVFRGRGPDALSPGGLDARPWLAFVGNEPDSPQSRLGYSIALADLDGDARPELVMGQPYYALGAATQNGAVRIWKGGALPAEPASAVLGPDDADWTWTGPGNEASDFFGWSVAVGDTDGQGPPHDLIVGTLQDEAPGGVANAGTVHVLPGRAGDFPDTAQRRVLGGDAGLQRFGVAAAPIADRDGDGLAELVVHAAFDNTLGPRFGRTFVVSSLGPRTPLDSVAVPSASGGEIGAATVVMPDGTVVVGGPRVQAANVATRIRAGAVTLHPADDDASTTLTIDGFGGHSTDDRLGDAVAALDFDGDGYADLAVVASQDDSGAACTPARTNSGAVHVFRGGAGGLATTPTFTYWGEQAGQLLHTVAGADLDGDGRDDLIVGGRTWDGADPTGLGRNVGGGAVVKGRVLGAVAASCTADWTFVGSSQDGQLGSALTRLGDLDGDGCEDVAIGNRLDDAPTNSSGSVRIVWGWGDACARQAPHTVRLSALAGAAEVGMAVHGGVDLDGDDHPELAIGGHQYRVNTNAVGAAWVVPGTWLASADDQAEPWQDGVAPPTLGLAPSDSTEVLVVTGRDAGEQLGLAVQLVPPFGDRPGALAVARPFSSAPGAAGAGTVSLYRFGVGGLDPSPVAGFAGETRRTFIEVGSSLAYGVRDGVPVLVVGARRATPAGLAAPGLDDGGAWIVIDPLAAAP